MTKLVLPALAAALLLGSASIGPVSAAPAGATPIAAPDSGVDTIRHTRRHRAYQRRAMKRRMYSRGSRMYAPSQAGNARNPERPVYQQNQGMTTGGPRY
jgi:hypothetical protein